MNFRLFDGSNDEYHADTTHAGSTVLNSFRKHPSLFKDWEDGRLPPTDYDAPQAKGLRLGIAVDAMVSGTFDQEVYVTPKVDRRTKVGKAEWAKVLEESRGLLSLPQHEHDTARRMFDALMSTPVACELLDGQGVEQLGAFWTDETTGQGLKCKWDSLRQDGIVVELKTRRPMDGLTKTPVRDWLYTVKNMGYDLQAALYVDGARRALGKPIQHVFITVSNEPPHSVLVFDTTPRVLQEGRDKLRQALDGIKECRETGRWQPVTWNRRLRLE